MANIKLVKSVGSSNAAPVTRQEYLLRLHRHKDLALNAHDHFALQSAGLIVTVKDKIVEKGRYRTRLLVAKLTPELHKRCTAFRLGDLAEASSKLIIQIEEYFQQYVDRVVARALASWLGRMIRERAMAA